MENLILTPAFLFAFGAVVVVLTLTALFFYFRPGTKNKKSIHVVSSPTPRNLYENTKSQIWGRIRNIFKQPLSEQETFAQIEEVLLTSDFGPKTVMKLTERLDETLSGQEKKDPEKLRHALRGEIAQLLGQNPVAQDLPTALAGFLKTKPTVLLIVGVNGAGKTTTIGKLARAFTGMGRKTMIAAGDTFRAAAKNQLGVWAERAGVEVFAPPSVTDPAAVAFEAVSKAKAQGFDVVIIDTAGRLHTQSHLMEELKKIKRVMAKVQVDAPHEVLLVLDANSGQNALVQAKMFHEALGVTGVVLTKMDGTAKGGVVIGLSYELRLPVYFIGVGEKGEDLKTFSPQEFLNGIFGDEETTLT